jgi:drug/metabolite transporter (DMT)-like permease
MPAANSRPLRLARSRLLLCLVTVYLVWSSSFLFTKIGVTRLPPFLFGSVRFLVGGALLFLFSRLSAIRHGEAVLPVLVSNGCNMWGLQTVTSGEAALLGVGATFLITLLGTMGPRAHPLTKPVLAGLLLGGVGLFLVVDPVGGSSAKGAGHTLAEAVTLVGCIGWAVGTIYQRNASIQLDLMGFTGLQMMLGGAMMAVPALLGGEPARWSWDPAGLASLAWMTVMRSCIAYSAFAWLSVNATPAQIGSAGLVNPALAALLGWWVLDERLSAAQVAGMGVILVGVLLATWPGIRDSAPPAAPRADA